MRYSLVIPFRDRTADLVRILPPLDSLSEEWEIFVVDDYSLQPLTDQLHSLPARVRVLRSQGAPGAAGARNFGAKQASGDILVFLDSDVLVESDTLQALVAAVDTAPELAAVFGCYGNAQLSDQTPLSAFRNLLHRHVHQRCAGPVESFWTGLGAIRADVFEQVGGFDEQLKPLVSIEDVELGYRLAKQGHRVHLKPEFEGIHLKVWTIPSMVKTDIVHRAAPWTRLLLSRRVGATLNAGRAFLLGPILLLIALGVSVWSLKLAGYLWLLYLLSQLRFLAYLANEAGAEVAAVGLFGLVIHHLCCWAGAGWGLCQYGMGRLTSDSVV